MNMGDTDHVQLLEKLAEIKQDVSDKFAKLDKGIDINTVKTTSIEDSVADIKSELKDIRLSFITHTEYEARHKAIQDEISLLTNSTKTITNDQETRMRSLENFKSIIFGGLILSNIVIVPILIWLVIRALS